MGASQSKNNNEKSAEKNFGIQHTESSEVFLGIANYFSPYNLVISSAKDVVK